MIRGHNYRPHAKYTTCKIFEKEIYSHRSSINNNDDNANDK